MAASKVESEPSPRSDGTYLARCATCGLSRRFYTVLGANGFRLDHTGHDVSISGSPEAAGPKPEYRAKGEEGGTRASPPGKPGPQARIEPREPEKAAPWAVGGRVETAERPVVAWANVGEGRDSLLLASSFYLQDDKEVEKEALRVSRVLRELKRGVEPPYLISVMIDDNVGIQASGDVIETDVVVKLEPLGYKFVAMNAPNGKPTAWFKKKKS